MAHTIWQVISFQFQFFFHIILTVSKACLLFAWHFSFHMDVKKSGYGTTKACQSNSVVQPLKILRECEEQGRVFSRARGFSSDMGRGEHDWDKNGTEKVAAFTNSHGLLSRDRELESRQVAVAFLCSKDPKNVSSSWKGLFCKCFIYSRCTHKFISRKALLVCPLLSIFCRLLLHYKSWHMGFISA